MVCPICWEPMEKLEDALELKAVTIIYYHCHNKKCSSYPVRVGKLKRNYED